MSAHNDMAAAVTVAATADDEVPVHAAVVASPHNSVVIGSVVDQTFLAAAAAAAAPTPTRVVPATSEALALQLP